MNCEVDVNENNEMQHMPHDHYQPQNMDWKEEIRDSTPWNRTVDGTVISSSFHECI
jgi:hypothetical protein